MTGTPWRSSLLVGQVSHSRLTPTAHAFAYPLFMLRLDLDEIAALDGARRAIGSRWWRPVRVVPEDFMGLAPSGGALSPRVARLRAAVVAELTGAGMTTPVGRIELIAHGRVLNYVFNPVSFFVCHASADDSLCAVVADVHNTFGERHAYVLPVSQAVAPGAWQQKKVFHVSPFFTLDGTYRFQMTFAAEAVDVRIDLWRDGAPVFVSRLALAARPLTDREVLRAWLRFPAMTARVIGAIHWQALRLWRKGLPYVPKPAHDPAHARRATRA